MARLFQFKSIFSLIGLSVLIFTGCQKPSSHWDSSKPFRTQIVVTNSTGNEIRVVSLEGVTDKKTLKGDVVQFFFAPGDVEGKVRGNAPEASFIKNSEGVHIPTDTLSLQMTTLYYHLQELKRLEFQVEPKGFIPWPRKVGIRVRSTNSNLKYNNAFYNSRHDMMFFVPYTSEETPVPLNAGILAHELFHAYFSYVITKPVYNDKEMTTLRKVDRSDLGELTDRVYTDYVLKSLNEGLADVWGWLYTMDPNFISVSLPHLGFDRTLDKVNKVESIKTKKTLRSDSKFFVNFEKCENNPFRCASELSYVNGSPLARAIKSFAVAYQQNKEISDQELRLVMAKKMFELLQHIRSSLEEETLSLEKALLDFSDLFPYLQGSECQVLQIALSQSSEGDKICLE